MLGSQQCRSGRITVLSCVIVGSLLLTGFGGRSAVSWWNSRQLTDQHASAWTRFSEATFPPTAASVETPEFQADFRLHLEIKGGQLDSDGLWHFKTQEPIDLMLESDQRCFMAVYLLSRDHNLQRPLTLIALRRPAALPPPDKPADDQAKKDTETATLKMCCELEQCAPDSSHDPGGFSSTALVMRARRS